MDQKTARKLAKLMCDDEKMIGRGLIFVAMTDYALRGEFDEADAQWIVFCVGRTDAAITEIPAEFAARMDEGPRERVPF